MNKTNSDGLQLVHQDAIPAVIMTGYQDRNLSNVFHHRAYMPSELNDYQPIVPLLDTLHMAGAQDTVSLVLNGDGGYVSTASHLAAAITRSQAVVVGEAFGRTSSAHTLMLLCCDVILPVQSTLVMAHNMNMGSAGSGMEPIQHVSAALHWCHSIFEEYQLPFLSVDEMEAIFKNNATLWFSDEDEINDRIFTTMWFRAATGALKPEAFSMFIELVNSGVYSNCQLVNISTLVELFDHLEQEGQVDAINTNNWTVMEHYALFGEHNNPVDYLCSLE
ncbi:hypothetical protein IACHDJAJ_00069 [Aeromonas phage vB_AdhS_TS3]|nr:hypothetical protein IACHDJAJ_00069 [Aeromonas phage vB_AdhS_TS3]